MMAVGAKRMKFEQGVSSALHCRLSTLPKDVLAAFSEAFAKKQNYHNEKAGLRIVCDPYPHCVIENLFDDEFLADARTEIMAAATVHRSNDLYDFYQTEDLKTTDNACLKTLRENLYGNVMIQLMQSLTHLSLSPVVDMSGHWYKDTGHLLCHDDKLEGRRIAYILYLVDKDWNEADGGRLKFYEVDDKLRPTIATAAITPRWNSLAFFEVTPTSYHEVEEVLTSSKQRVSVSGWFHGLEGYVPAEGCPLLTDDSLLNTVPVPFNPTNLMAELINDDYNNESFMRKAQKRFSRDSSLLLVDLLKEPVYQTLLDECQKATVKVQGRPDCSRYHVLQGNSPMRDKVVQFLTSDIFRDWLQQITNLPVVQIQSQRLLRYRKGDYTLLHDQAKLPPGLDVDFCICPPWQSEWNGQTVYCADTADEDHHDAPKDSQDSAILCVDAIPNSLSLVLRDEGCMRFTKYINHLALADKHEFSICFEVDFDEGEEEEEEEREEEEEDEDEDDDESDNDDDEEEEDDDESDSDNDEDNEDDHDDKLELDDDE